MAQYYGTVKGGRGEANPQFAAAFLASAMAHVRG